MPDYEAPCFPIVQSSGVGKTKLLFDYKKKMEKKSRRVFVVSCISPGAGNEKKAKAKYDFYLDLKRMDPKEKVKSRNTFVAQLKEHANIVRVSADGKSSGDEVVFLFDEAQALTKDEGFLIRCLRWFVRTESLNANVVAVLAGTTSFLANFYPEIDEETKASRKGGLNDYHKGCAGLFPPFFDIWTMGCLSNMIMVDESESDYQKAIPYGRPLFARLIAPIDPNKPQEAAAP